MARACAVSGAAYPQLASATALTPQGARQRWPGLAQVRKAALLSAAESQAATHSG